MFALNIRSVCGMDVGVRWAGLSFFYLKKTQVVDQVVDLLGISHRTVSKVYTK